MSTLPPQYKKQIAYPQFFSRLLATLLDMTFLSFLTSPIMNYVGLFLFKLNFGDFAAEHNLKLDGANDITTILQADGFYENSAATQYMSFFLEYSFIQFFLFAIYFVIVWNKFGTSLGKFFFKIKIVDYNTLGGITLPRAIIRYIGYLLAPVSIFFMIFDSQKRAIHDRMANTLVTKN